MAHLEEGVIELGSSDEEIEPAPKKKKPMVQIPKNLPGITISPTNKSKTNPVSIGKDITVKNVKVSSGKVSNPFALQNIQNMKSNVRKHTVQIHPAIANNSGLTVIPVKKVKQIPTGKIPLKIAKGLNAAPNILRQLPSGILPPGITVKRTNLLQSAINRNVIINPANMRIKRKTSNTATKRTASAMVCVDLDDDDSSPSSPAPLWYMRPEEQEKKVVKHTDTKEKDVKNIPSEAKPDLNMEEPDSDLQKLNNKEPDNPKYIEITIEDSPAKPQPKRTCEVSELAITIDDSPVKVTADKAGSASGSDEEATVSKEKHSKKKLEYSKAGKLPETMEIEIELTPVENVSKQNIEKTDAQGDVVETEVVEIEESPLKLDESIHTSTPKKKLQPNPVKLNNITSVSVPKSQTKLNNNKTGCLPKPHLQLNEIKTVPSTPGEFHPVYQSFIDLCFLLENSEDMSKIVEKKIKAYYKQVPKEYTESEMFTDMVLSKINAMKAGPEKMYLYIKDVVDELNMQRKIAKAQPPTVVTINEEQEKCLYGEDSEFDSKRQRQIRKLEKTLKKLHRAIQKLEVQEVDFDDDEDSVYLLTERYKERMIRVHAKFCQLTNTKMPSEPRVQIDARPGQPKGPAKRLEKWINKKVPIGTPMPFPDFHDVIRCVRDANQEDKLFWNEADIVAEARDLFTRCGKKLQRRRQENEWRLAASRIQSEVDPAENDDVLKKALEENRRITSRKESEVLNKYADRQNQLNLEAVEIGDKEADESPVETDDEEPTEENTSLETKEKRKERLKRLIHKKSKEATNCKEQANINLKESEINLKPDVNAKESGENNELSGDKSQMETEESLLNKQKDIEKDPPSGKPNTEDPLVETENSGSQKIHSLSDDSNQIDSDIDELHLLQKLHSDVVDTSTLESSDSESPIAISDGLSSDDNRKHSSDVISIENSSYSESEKNNEQEYEIVSYSQKNTIAVQMEIECSDAGVEMKINKSNNDEYNESVEDILLASSDDEANKDANSEGSAIKETNVEQPKKDKNTACTTVESIDMIDDSSDSVVVHTNLNENKIDNAAISCEDVDSIANEVTSTNSLDAVDDATTTGLVENADKVKVVASVKSAESVEHTDTRSTKEVQDETMTSLIKNGETADIKSAEVEELSKNNEVASDKLTKPDNDKITNTDKPDASTLEITSNEINTTANNGINNVEDSENTDITGVIDKESDEKTLEDLPMADCTEPMVVDNDTVFRLELV